MSHKFLCIKTVFHLKPANKIILFSCGPLHQYSDKYRLQQLQCDLLYCVYVDPHMPEIAQYNIIPDELLVIPACLAKILSCLCMIEVIKSVGLDASHYFVCGM